jgi:hypothetical protein
LKHKDADILDVLDTGSTDGTWEKLNELAKLYTNLHISQHKFDNFRFDIARNFQLDLLKKYVDENAILFQIDIDEYITGENWVDEIKSQFKGDISYYDYIYSWTDDGRPCNRFLANKIHTFKKRWIGPIHEALEFEIGENNIIKGITLEHHSTYKPSRENYINLLRMRFIESPDDSRNALYYGRELFFHKQYDKAIDILLKYVNMKDAWIHEIGYACYIISQCFLNKNMIAESYEWCINALEIDGLKMYVKDLKQKLVSYHYAHLLKFLNNYPLRIDKSSYYWDEA